MPTPREIAIYLNGLWLLFRRDPAGFRYLDLTDRGVVRSFWSIVWCAPSIVLSWIWWRLSYLEAMAGSVQSASLFFFRLSMVEVANWLVPLVLAGVLCLALDVRDKFPAIVIATNWLALPASYVYGILTLLMIVAPGLAGLVALLWFFMMMTLVAILFRIIWMICGDDHLLLVATLTMVLLIPGMLLSEALERYLGVFPR